MRNIAFTFTVIEEFINNLARNKNRRSSSARVTQLVRGGQGSRRRSAGFAMASNKGVTGLSVGMKFDTVRVTKGAAFVRGVYLSR